MLLRLFILIQVGLYIERIIKRKLEYFYTFVHFNYFLALLDAFELKNEGGIFGFGFSSSQLDVEIPLEIRCVVS
jgi:hypothetical protein